MLKYLHERPLDTLECPNQDCTSHHSKESKGLKVRYLRGKGTIRYLRCNDCGLEFSERQGSPLFGLHMTEDKAYDILNHLAEGCGIRKTSRLCHAQEETVIRLQRRCGEHFKRWHDSQVRGVRVREAQLDEKWSFVKKKQKHCSVDNPADEQMGDQWDHVAIDAETRMVISMVPGKRTTENTVLLIEDFIERTDGSIPALITSDEYAPYETVLGQAYGEDVLPLPSGKPGRLLEPHLVPSPELVYATVHKERKKGRVVHVRQTLVYGEDMQLREALEASSVSSTINTSIVERYNGTDRCFNSRKVRSTYEFSKNIELHEAASWFAITVYNFCRFNRALVVKKKPRTLVETHTRNGCWPCTAGLLINGYHWSTAV